MKITKNALSAKHIDKPKEFDQKAGHLSQGKGTLELTYNPYNGAMDNYRGKKVAQVNHNFTRKPTTIDRCLLNLWHDMIQIITEENFGIGFVGEESVRAERYIDDNGFPFYLINPDPLQIDTLDQIIFTIYENACHEIAHVFYSSHNESFCSKFSSIYRNNLTNILSNLPKFRATIRHIKTYKERL